MVEKLAGSEGVKVEANLHDWRENALRKKFSEDSRLDFIGEICIVPPGVMMRRDETTVILRETMMFIAPKTPTADLKEMFNLSSELQNYFVDEFGFWPERDRSSCLFKGEMSVGKLAIRQRLMTVGAAIAPTQSGERIGLFRQTSVFIFPDKISAEEALKNIQTKEGQEDPTFLYLNEEQVRKLEKRNGFKITSSDPRLIRQ